MSDQQTLLKRLRDDRNRFIAFAFAAADMLVEVGADGAIVFAAGSTRGLVGRAAEELVGLSVYDVVARADHAMMREVLQRMNGVERLTPVTLRLAGQRGTPVAQISGYRLSEFRDHFFLAFALQRQATALHGAGRDQASGLLKADGFAEVARQHALKAGEGGEAGKLTLLEIPEAKKLGKADGDELAASIGALLRAHSIDGESAGRLDEGRYGIVHSNTLDKSALEDRIEEIAREVLPSGVAAIVRATSLDLAQPGVDPGDLAQALVYTVNQFSAEKGTAFTLETLANEYQKRLSKTVDRIRSVRDVVAGGNFQLFFQPIVELANRRLHHYEALARFPSAGDGEESPQATIAFAEDVGLILSVDEAICRRAIEWLNGAGADARNGIAVNLSGRSLGEDGFVERLHDMIADGSTVKGRLMFEVTESSTIRDLDVVNKVIQSFRRRGYPVCLDDLGAGAAAFQYLRALQVDYVKIDGSYVRDLMQPGPGKAFIKAMTQLANDLGMKAIAEMVEDQSVVDVLREIGVTYGQGYLFGKPSPDLKSFANLPRLAQTGAGRR